MNRKMKQKLINFLIILASVLLFIIFIVNAEDDIIPPQIITASPTGKITIESTTLIITTDENATCLYSTTDNVNYENKQGIFDTTGKITHTESLEGLTDGIYHYYIRCKDSAGNIATSDYDASFEVDLPPSAQITLSDSSPVKAGMIKLTLITSEEVKPVPSLTYSFDGETHTYVPITGSGRTWTGYIIIEESSNNQVGSFKFSATDLNGNIGNVITTGNIFIVDTKKPDIITSIKAVGKEDYIKLVWYYDEDDAESYNIYRSTSSGVDYLDLYEDVEKTSMEDSSVTAGKTYYYKVSVVDKAGNEGGLSKEVYATVLLESTEVVKEEPTRLSSELIGEVDSVINTINQVLTEADNSITNLETKQQDAVKALDLISKINDGKKELNTLKSDLENIKSQDLTKVELDKKIERIKLQIKIIKRNVPDNILQGEESENMQSITADDLESVINEIQPGMEESERKKYVKTNQQLQNNIKVTTKIKQISISYLDGSQKDFTLVQKDVAIKELSDSISLVEVIPKTVVENINDIELKTSGYEIIKEDPIVKWSDIISDKKIEYIINKKADLEEVKKTRLIALLNPEAPENEPENKITGFAGGSSSYLTTTSLGMITGLLIIICLSAYYFAFVKKGKKFTEERKNIIETIKGMKNLGNGHEITDKPIESVEKYENLMGTESATPEMMIKKDKNASSFTVNQPPPNDRCVNVKDLHPLLNKAHKFIDNLNFNRSVEVYSIILSTYNLLSYEEKQNVNSSITMLYNKLLLYLTINEAYTNLENHEQLKASLNHMTSLYNNITKIASSNTELLNQARNKYDYFSNLFKKDAMEPF